MSRSIRKFVAVFIAIWLPMFSGNALAVSVAMQTTGSNGHHAVAAQHEHHMHQTPAAHHGQPTADQDQSACHQDSQNSGSDDCGICHLACCGYMATLSMVVAEAQPFAQSFIVSSTQFESIALTLLDPPPLARA